MEKPLTLEEYMKLNNLTKEQAKDSLIDLLDDLLRSGNQDGSVVSSELDVENEKLTVVFNVVNVHDDLYLGLAGY